MVSLSAEQNNKDTRGLFGLDKFRQDLTMPTSCQQKLFTLLCSVQNVSLEVCILCPDLHVSSLQQLLQVHCCKQQACLSDSLFDWVLQNVIKQL